jgi:hypothetical protein
MLYPVDPESQPRKYTQSRSIRERLYRKYHEQLEKDAPIDPILEELLFDTDTYEEESYRKYPFLKKVTQEERVYPRLCWGGR